jgi:DNA repair protein RadC
LNPAIPEDVAESLLSKHGSIVRLLQANTGKIATGPLDGFFESVRQLLEQALAPTRSGKAISSSVELMDYLKFSMAHLHHEQVRVLFLNARHLLLLDEIVSIGTIDEAPIYPREIVRRALEVGASALIVAHNHPSGDATPTQQDISVTDRLQKACHSMGISVLDHVIVASSNWTSLKNEGYIS